MTISELIVTYQDLKDRKQITNDDYGVASYEYEQRRKAFLANPNLSDLGSTFMYLGTADNVIVGRVMLFDTKIKAGNDIVLATAGSSLLVHENYRQFAIGLDIMNYQANYKHTKVKFAAGISSMALPINEKQKYFVFRFPLLCMYNSASSLVTSLGIKGVFKSVFSFPLSIFFHFKYKKLRNRYAYLCNDYSIEKVDVVPDWVDSIVLEDGHKYAEVHDSKWLQWNLDYSFKEGPCNIQSFYIVSFRGRRCGFFMTKERLLNHFGRMKNIIKGSIVEWGIDKEQMINESDINILALSSFSKRTAIIELASDNHLALDTLTNYGLKTQGEANCIFKDNTKSLYCDAKEQHLWRLRLGSSDAILS